MNVLIVDDDTNQLYIMEEKIERNIDVNIFEAQDGLQALEIISCQKNIDIVISDITMPNMDGINLLSSVKKLKPEMLVILVTGDSIYKNDEVKKMGALGLLYKPVDEDKLMDMIFKTNVDFVLKR